MGLNCEFTSKEWTSTLPCVDRCTKDVKVGLNCVLWWVTGWYSRPFGSYFAIWTRCFVERKGDEDSGYIQNVSDCHQLVIWSDTSSQRQPFAFYKNSSFCWELEERWSLNEVIVDKWMKGGENLEIFPWPFTSLIVLFSGALPTP